MKLLQLWFVSIPRVILCVCVSVFWADPRRGSWSAVILRGCCGDRWLLSLQPGVQLAPERRVSEELVLQSVWEPARYSSLCCSHQLHVANLRNVCLLNSHSRRWSERDSVSWKMKERSFSHCCSIQWYSINKNNDEQNLLTTSCHDKKLNVNEK